MCIIAFKPAEKEISKETLQECWDHNPDGAGYMYNVNGKLHIKKGFFKFQDFYKSYAASCKDKKAVLHFRIKTHGEINKENCHPFNINDSLAFVHNGIIGAVDTTSDKTKSDTWHFNDHILKPLVNKYSDILEADSFQLMVGDFIGASKLVFLDDQDNVKIFNEDKGTWDDGIWYSNTSYKPRVVHQSKHTNYSGTHIIPFTPNQPSMAGPTGSHYPKARKHSSFGAGSLVELKARWDEFPWGTEGVVQSINADFSANVMFYHPLNNSTKMCYRVPFAIMDDIMMEQTDEEWFQHSYI